MTAPSEPTRELKEAFERLLEQMNDEGVRTAFDKYIELECALVDRYQKLLREELTTNTDVLQDFTKMFIGACLDIAAFQRESRARFLDLQSSIADAHLRFLEALKERISRTAQTSEQKEASHGC